MVFGNKLFTVQCGYRPTCKTHSCSWLGLYRTSWSWNEDSNPGLLLCTMRLNSLWSRTWIFLYSNDATLSKSPLYLFLQSQQPKLWIQIFPKFLTKFCKSWFLVYCVFFKNNLIKKKSWKFRVCTFGVGLWIGWQRQWI